MSKNPSCSTELSVLLLSQFTTQWQVTWLQQTTQCNAIVRGGDLDVQGV